MTVSAVRIPDFDVWRETYGGALVSIKRAGTEELAPVYRDENLTEAADNPQVLASMTIEGRVYGKFVQPVYTNQQVYLEINSNDQSGRIRPPLVSLNDEDASNATSRTQRGARARRLIERFNDVVHALDFGSLGGSSAQNTTTLKAAIGAAAGQDGGAVLLPAGQFPFTTLTLPQNVVLTGEHELATTLQSEEDQNVITISGDGAGLRDMTLDGIILEPNSVGVFSKANNRTVFDNVTVKRFNTGLLFKGGSYARWRNFSINNCSTGANLTGDLDIGGGSDGAAFEFNRWLGGIVNECSLYGVRLNFVDQLVRHNSLQGVGFIDNPAATALEINGARYTEIRNPYWSNNLRNLLAQDDTDTSQELLNTVINLIADQGYANGGEFSFDGTCQDVIFKNMSFAGVEWVMQIPDNNVTLVDSTEDIDVTITGDGTKLQRKRTADDGGVVGITTDATATTAWAYEISPGSVVYARAEVIANQRNGEGRAVYDFSVGAYRPGGTLNYDNQISDFVLGEIVTGQTSGAQALIVADSDSGASGTLTLRDITGTFENNEQITGASLGDAQVNGAMTLPNASLDTVGLTVHRTPYETSAGWNATFVVSSGEIQLRVAGEASKTIEWNVSVKIFAP